MTDDIGRNDPCACGSGKKYKKCCLNKHRDGSAGERSVDDPGALSWKQQLKHFRSMNLPEKFAFFRDRYRDPDEVSGDYFMELMFALFREVARGETHAEFQTLIDDIREHRSDLADEFGAWLDRWHLMSVLWSDASITEDDLQRFIDAYGEDPDVMETVLWAFLYRGRNEDLRTVLPGVVSRLRNRNDLMPGAADFPAEKGINIELFHDLNQPDEQPDPEEWIASNRGRLEQYFDEFKEDNLASLVRDATGRSRESWSPADFVLSTNDRESPEPSPAHRPQEMKAGPEGHRENYRQLGRQFMRHLNVMHSVPWARAEMIASDLVIYLLDRADKRLGPRESLLEADQREQRGEPAPEQKEIPPEQLLIPDGETLERYLDRKQAMFDKHAYRRVALYTNILEWLAFLEERSLATREQARDSLESITFLQDQLVESLEHNLPDPLLLVHLRSSSVFTAFSDDARDAGQPLTKTDETIRRLIEDIFMAERKMYQVEEGERLGWDRIENPIKKLAEHGRTGNVEPVRAAFHDLIQNCSSGITFAFAGQYSILTAPDEPEPVLDHLDHRLRNDLEQMENGFEALKNRRNALSDLGSKCLLYYLDHVFPYLFQFLRRTGRSIEPSYIDRVLDTTVPAYFDLYNRMRTYFRAEQQRREHPFYPSFHVNLTSLFDLLQTFYSALSGKPPGELDHPKQERPDEDAERDVLPEVPEDLLRWTQVRWNYHRPDEGNWTPDPIEGDHPLDQIDNEWTFELSESS